MWEYAVTDNKGETKRVKTFKGIKFKKQKNSSFSLEASLKPYQILSYASSHI